MKLDLDIVEKVTPQWISNVFRQNNFLHSGNIVSLVRKPISDASFETPKIIRAFLEYSPDATGYLPRTIIIKTAKNTREKFFYEELAKKMKNPGIPKCLYSEGDERGETSLFLLEDLGATHGQTEWPVPPSFAKCKESIQSIAEIHAFWWQHPYMELDFSQKLAGEDRWQDRIELASKKTGTFFDFMDDNLSPERIKIYEDVLSSANEIWQPKNAKYARTLIHGDAHFWNFLFPKSTTDHIRVIDWSMWDIGKGTDDLAYMIGLHWYPERRARFEKTLLEHYYATLLNNDVSNYSWENCWDDYRHSVVMNLFIPVWQWQRGITQIIWWSHLERSFLTFEDLGCDELL